MKKLKALICAVAILGSLFTKMPITAFAAQSDELRAVWISTVYNLDFPAVGSSAEAQKQEFINKLDAIAAMGLNTVVVQIRPKADALYQSAINPWSDVLTGTQGKNPGYDPLSFMIEQAHNRGMEFHAWMNPYRITTSGADLQALAENHPARVNHGLVITYKNALYYNPELAEVKEHIAKTVAEIVNNYNVDAIHFDDYFYPSNYPLNEGETRDGAQANKRREDVNDMIKMVSQTIKSIKPNVKFGISPLGIWKNESSDATGSKTTGSEGYYAVYGDARNWIQNGYIDYIVPQIYWPTQFAVADYETLVAWWTNEVKGTNVKIYIGQAVYKDEVASQITTQLDINKKYSANGSFYFSLKELLNNRQGAADAIKNYYNAQDGSNVTPDTPAQEPPIGALFSTAKVKINGNNTEFEAYNIQDSNYFKLRDLAMALNGSQKQFGVTWEENAKAIGIVTGESYTGVGGELVSGDKKDKMALPSIASLMKNGNEVKLAAYNINDNTYFKLRDVAYLADFYVGWEDASKTIAIDTSRSYES